MELEISKYTLFFRLLKFQCLWNLINGLSKTNYENGSKCSYENLIPKIIVSFQHSYSKKNLNVFKLHFEII